MHLWNFSSRLQYNFEIRKAQKLSEPFFLPVFTNSMLDGNSNIEVPYIWNITDARVGVTSLINIFPLREVCQWQAKVVATRAILLTRYSWRLCKYFFEKTFINKIKRVIYLCYVCSLSVSHNALFRTYFHKTFLHENIGRQRVKVRC